MKKIILIGAGGHAKSIIDLIESKKEMEIIGLIGYSDQIGKSILGYKVLGDDSKLKDIKKFCNNAVLTVGQIKDCLIRKELETKLSNLGFKFPIISSSYSLISKYANIDQGTTIGHGAVINAGVNIGKHTIINSQSLIEHDSIIGNFCHISTGALINGGTEIGDESFIGSNTMIRENIKIPPRSCISAGSKIMSWPNKK